MYDLNALREAAVVLENERGFYDEYTLFQHAHTKAVEYRRLIQRWLKRCNLPPLTTTTKGQDREIHEAYAREQLRRYFHNRYDLPPPCEDKSSCADLDTVDFWNDPEENPMAYGPVSAEPVQPAQPENTMSNTITVEQRTFVNNVDVSKMTDREIYSLISQAEAEIKSLELIENKPKRLQKDIEDRKAGIKALVEHLDARDAK